METNNLDFEELYHEMEKAKHQKNDAQLRFKELKDMIIEKMNEKGIDELVIDGLDSTVKLMITYPERPVLNQKGLAEALNIKQKELSKPYMISKLTEEGKLTSELIEQFTMIEERMQFSVKEVTPEEESLD